MVGASTARFYFGASKVSLGFSVFEPYGINDFSSLLVCHVYGLPLAMKEQAKGF